MNDIILDNSIYKKRFNLSRILSAESVKFPFYTSSKINDIILENQIGFNSINDSVLNNAEPVVNKLKDH